MHLDLFCIDHEDGRAEELTYYESALRRDVLGISDKGDIRMRMNEFLFFFFFFFEQKNNCRYNHLHHIKYL